MKYLIGLMVMALLAGCQSEVDKCVESSMASWDAYKKRQVEAEGQAIKNPKSSGNHFDQFDTVEKVDVDKRTRVEVEAEKRMKCLRAASGKS